MKKNGNRWLCFALFVVVAFTATVTISGLSYAGDTKNSKTLDNLQAAFNGESNAHAKYLAYAEKADAEGYGRVASLFRAAASAEKIHLTNHAQVIKSMGATPKAEIKLPEIKSTSDNLADAIKGESYERDTMYPDFLSQAKQDDNPDAIRTFTYAQAAEAEHARLYQKALSNLASWKAPKADFYVCPVCGYTVEGNPSFASCPVCATPASLYVKVD